jgi:hypothetical protein
MLWNKKVILIAFAVAVAVADAFIVDVDDSIVVL